MPSSPVALQPASVKQRQRLLRVIGIGRQVRVGVVVVRRQHARQHHGPAAVQLLGQQLLVDGVVERLAHLDVVKRRTVDVELQPQRPCACARLELDALVLCQRVRQLRRHFLDDVDLAGQQRRHPCGRFRDDPEDRRRYAGRIDRRQVGRAAVVVVKARQHKLVHALGGLKLEGTGPDGLVDKPLRTGAFQVGLGHDLLVHQQLERRRPRAREVHEHGAVVLLLNRFQRRDQALARRRVRLRILDHVFLDDAVKRVDDVVGRHLRPVVELDPGAQLDFKRLVIDPLDRLRQLHVHAAFRVACHQPVKHVANDCLRFAAAVIRRVDRHGRTRQRHDDGLASCPHRSCLGLLCASVRTCLRLCCPWCRCSTGRRQDQEHNKCGRHEQPL